ncbi:MAG TPA: D-erythronate dehydrogenase [Crenalkalicoccus sp.]|nr:D-erythronate dehydrogenase [Crenalkalicoccus sp.]
MRITILGGGGFLGRKLAARLARDGALAGRAITGLTLFDLAAPPAPAAGFAVRALAGNVADAEAVQAAIPPETEVVFHLAAVVSAQAEAEWEIGMRVNLDGARTVLEACRRLPRPARLVFTSSAATFSGGQEAVVEDDARQLPTNSYGAQKAAAELLLQDASRRGFLDAVNIRLPTVIIRPGRPNRAASSFVSAILREPLLGQPAELPVPPAFAVWICSPRRAVEWFLHAATMDTLPLGVDRGVNPPGRSATVAQMLNTLEAVAGHEARALVHIAPDPEIERIVADWPAAFTAERARRLLGFSEQESLEEVIQAFVAEDLEATRRERGL